MFLIASMILILLTCINAADIAKRRIHPVILNPPAGGEESRIYAIANMRDPSSPAMAGDEG